MITRDLTHETPDWIVTAGRHCGELCWGITCPTCGEYVKRPAVKIPTNIELGSE